MEEKEQFNCLLLGQLAKIKRWTKFLSVLNYIATVLMVVIGVVMGVFGTNLSSLGDAYSAVPGPLFALIYLAGAALYYFSARYLNDMSKSADMAAYTSETNHIESLIAATAKLFSFWGIVTAIALALYFLIIILAIVIGISGLG